MSFIHAENISFTYNCEDSVKKALCDISFDINKGEFIAILGSNGSGKSTLAKHLNAILELQSGNLTVADLGVSDQKNLWQLRRTCGMVFQNPDNQFISTVVEEDIAFGLRNFNTDTKNIPDKVNEALSIVDMDGCNKRSPSELSGGQKQRIAMAGVLAVEPDIVIFDEATSMLDPKGRLEIISYLHKLHNAGKTVIMITHYCEEAVSCDRVFILKEGMLIGQGSPREILTDTDMLKNASLSAPMSVNFYYDLQKRGIKLPRCPLTMNELAEEICQLNQKTSL